MGKKAFLQEKERKMRVDKITLKILGLTRQVIFRITTRSYVEQEE